MEDPDTDLNESVYTESEWWFTSTQGLVRGSGDVTGTALLCLSFPGLVYYSRLTVNGGQYGAGASINGRRPRGAGDAICSAYYQGRADTAPSVPSAAPRRAASASPPALSAPFPKHCTIDDSTQRAQIILIACRRTYATLGRLKQNGDAYYLWQWQCSHTTQKTCLKIPVYFESLISSHLSLGIAATN